MIEGVLAGEGEPGAGWRDRGLALVRDDTRSPRQSTRALAANPDIAEKIRGGKIQAAGAVVGAVMKATKGQADAARVRELVLSACGVNPGKNQAVSWCPIHQRSRKVRQLLRRERLRSVVTGKRPRTGEVLIANLLIGHHHGCQPCGSSRTQAVGAVPDRHRMGWADPEFVQDSQIHLGVGLGCETSSLVTITSTTPSPIRSRTSGSMSA